MIIVSLNAPLYSKGDPFGILEDIKELIIGDIEVLVAKAESKNISLTELGEILAQCDKTIQQMPDVSLLQEYRARIQKIYQLKRLRAS